MQLIVPTIRRIDPPRIMLTLIPHRRKPWFKFIRWGVVGLLAGSLSVSVLTIEFIFGEVLRWMSR